MRSRSQLQEELDRAEYLVQYWKNQYDEMNRAYSALCRNVGPNTDTRRTEPDSFIQREMVNNPEPGVSVPYRLDEDTTRELQAFIARRVDAATAKLERAYERLDKHHTERYTALAKRTTSLETRVRRLERLDG